MKRTLVTALLLPFFLLTVGSLGCKAAALPLSAPVAAAMAEEGLTVNPSTIQHFSVRKNGTTHRRCGAAHLRDVPPLTKGRCFIPSRMKQRGNTPRKCGVYGHCRDSTSEVSAECAECIDVPPTRTVAAATVAQHDEVVMFLRQPSAATSLCEEGLSSTQQSACYSQQVGALEQLTRQKTRDQAQEALQVMLTDTALTQEQKDELTAQAGGMVQAIETEGRIENRIKAKGFDECMVYCSSEKVDVIVKAPELQEGQVVQIRDIILGETKVPVENISIVSVK